MAKPDGTPPPSVTLTLSSETGRRSTQLNCNQSYKFESLAPARYEVFGQLTDNTESGFIELDLDQLFAFGLLDECSVAGDRIRIEGGHASLIPVAAVGALGYHDAVLRMRLSRANR